MRDLGWWFFPLALNFVKNVHCYCKHSLVKHSLVCFINNVPNVFKYILGNLSLAKRSLNFLRREVIGVWKSKAAKRLSVHLSFFNFHKPNWRFNRVKFLLCFFGLIFLNTVISVWKEWLGCVSNRININFIKVWQIISYSNHSFGFWTHLHLRRRNHLLKHLEFR